MASLKTLRNMRRMTSKPVKTEEVKTAIDFLHKCQCGGKLEIEWKPTLIPNKYARVGVCSKCHCRQFSHGELAVANDSKGEGNMVCERCSSGTTVLIASRVFNCLVCRGCENETKM